MFTIRRLAVVLVLMWGAAVSANAVAQTITIKFSHVVAPDTPKGKAAEKFRQLAEASTKGRVKVEIYPNSQLYRDGDELEALQRGAVHMLAPSVSKFGPLGVRDFEVFDLPYLFPSAETVYRVTDGEIGQRLFAKLEPKGIKGLAYWDNGFKQISANRPLRKVADFRAAKVRVQSSKVLSATFRKLGAIPQVMAFSEVYTALQQGVVDGQENPLMNIHASKLFEVQKFISLTGHKYEMTPFLMSKRTWDRLAEADRKLVQEAAAEATALQRKLSKESDDMLVADLKAKGVQVDAVDKASFQRATASVVAKWEGSPIGAFVKQVVAAARAQ